MKYKLIEETSSYALEGAVTKHLKDGWKPQGGIHYSLGGFASYYKQAMIKED